MGSLETTDAESAAVATHPRVTLDQIKNSISEVIYLQGESLFISMGHASIDHTNGEPPKEPTIRALEHMTIALVVMHNGFTVIGKAAPASPENFNSELGKKFAYEDAIRQIWPLMGFMLREHLSAREAEERGG